MCTPRTVAVLELLRYEHVTRSLDLHCGGSSECAAPAELARGGGGGGVQIVAANEGLGTTRFRSTSRRVREGEALVCV